MKVESYVIKEIPRSIQGFVVAHQNGLADVTGERTAVFNLEDSEAIGPILKDGVKLWLIFSPPRQ